MKKIIFLLFFLNQASANLKADTIDFCQVYLNGVEIYQNNQNSFGQVFVLKSKELKSTDILTINYFRDTPCHDCACFMQIRTADSITILTSEGKGTFDPISFKVKELLEYCRRTNTKIVDVFRDENNPYFKKGQLLFRIKLE